MLLNLIKFTGSSIDNWYEASRYVLVITTSDVNGMFGQRAGIFIG